MTLLGHSSGDSALSDTTSVTDARRFDAGRAVDTVDANGHTWMQRRAAVTLAAAAGDREDLRRLLEMCGLLPAGSSGDASS